MLEIKNEEMKNIIGGGINFTGAIISALKGFISPIFEIGQAVGGAIRRVSSGNLCNF